MRAGFDGIVKAAVAAMQPSALKLGTMQKRVARADTLDGEEAARILREDMLHAIAAAGRPAGLDHADPYGRLSLVYGQNCRPGDPLGELLWRVKWLQERSPQNVTRAAHLLIHRLGKGARRRLSPTMQVVAVIALLEWLGDRCPECRPGAKPGQRREHPTGTFWCPACEGYEGTRRMTTTARAMAVGRTTNAWLGAVGRGMDVATFERSWAKRYEVVLSLLTAAERRLSRAIDKQLRWTENPLTDSGEEQDHMPGDEPDASSGSTGDLRPRKSPRAA
jgi:hypothetical protein